MTTSLVDPEGFPRADIDVYAVRHARVSLNRLRNDHRDVVDRLGRVLEEVYAVGAVVEPRLNGAGGGKMVNGDGPGSGSSSAGVRPLARVNMVSENSPSATAVRPACTFERQTSQVNGLHLTSTFPQGLQRGDLIIQFGDLSPDQGHALADIGQLVQRSEGVRISPDTR
jgi:26S proteasome non-ATPase regulatory subunit 9